MSRAGLLHRNPTTDAYTAERGGIYATESGQATFTDGRGGKYWFIDTTGGSVTVTLPDARTVAADTQFTVKRTTAGANTLTVATEYGNIDGAATLSIATQYASYTVISDGSQYWII